MGQKKASSSSALFMALILVAMAINILSPFTQAAEPGVIVGLDIDSTTLFTAKGANFEVVNVARAQKDQTKHTTLKFTLKGGTQVKSAKSSTHQAKRSSWQLALNDETTMDVRVENLTTAHEMTVTWPGNTESQDEERELCFSLGKNVKW